MKNRSLLTGALFAAIVSCVLSSTASAALYAKLPSIRPDTPINFSPDFGGGAHPYSGNNLEPFANLPGADLTGADLTCAILYGANLFAADLTGAGLSGAILYGAELSGADLTGAFLDFADLSGVNLSNANLYGAILLNADLSGADLTGADLTRAIWEFANLDGVRSGGIIGSPIALPTNWQLINGYLIGPGANLSNANLSGAILSNADLSGADLTGADLTGADLTGVISANTVFTGAFGNTLVSLINDQAAQLANEYTLSEIADLRPGSSMIEVIGGNATLNMKVEESTDLINWSDTGQTTDVVLPAPNPGVKFFRFGD